ncbi:MAG: serine hydrolase [Chitinophagaceae bacterium]
MKFLTFSGLILLTAINVFGQEKTPARKIHSGGDKWLEQLLYSQASPLLKHILDMPDTFQYQLIYTQINRDKNNQPHFKNYYLHLDKNKYFNPASTVKLPVVLSALEKLHELNIPGLTINTPMLTDSSYSGQVKVYTDSLSENGSPSVAQYIKEIFLISDNDAYNRLYEFVGQQTLNEKLWQKGYAGSRITRRFMPATEEENRHTNAIRFVQNGQLIYQQAAAVNTKPFDFSRQHLVGNAYYNRHDSLINQPMDFTTHNVFPLQDLQQMMQSVLFPQSVPAKQRFALTAGDYRFLYQYMSELPYESRFPHYDTTEYFESYAKFFMFKAGKAHIPSYIRIFNKPGWTYGFLIDAAYIADFKNNIEFMISACIYTNSDGVLNDDKYDYDTVGYPFFQETGNIIYNYELKRYRKYAPDLSTFKMDYRSK